MKDFIIADGKFYEYEIDLIKKIKSNDELVKIFKPFMPIKEFDKERFLMLVEEMLDSDSVDWFELRGEHLYAAVGDELYVTASSILRAAGLKNSLSLGMITIGEAIYTIQDLLGLSVVTTSAYSNMLFAVCASSLPVASKNVLSNALTNCIKDVMSERAFQNSEKKLLDKFIKHNDHNLTFTERKNHPLHIPDGWVLIDGIACPLEAKSGDFDRKALSQLERYMGHFNSPYGVAVASKLTVELPDNIFFYNIRHKKV